MKKNRTFRKKRGANNGRLNRHINSTHKMKGGGRRLILMRQRLVDIVRRFRGQPQQRDDASSPLPLPPSRAAPPPSPVIGERISRDILPGFPPISESHFRILQDRVNRLPGWMTEDPQSLFLRDLNILVGRIDEMRRRLKPIKNDTTIPETTRETIIRDFEADIAIEIVSWLESGQLLHTMKMIYEALRKAYRTAGLVEVQVKESENVPFSPSSSSRSSSSRSPEHHPYTRSLSRKSRRSPQPPPPPPPSREDTARAKSSINSRAKRREKWEQEWRMLTALPGTINYPNKKAEKMPLLGARP